jgi:hypothetical protein
MTMFSKSDVLDIIAAIWSTFGSHDFCVKNVKAADIPFDKSIVMTFLQKGIIEKVSRNSKGTWRYRLTIGAQELIVAELNESTRTSKRGTD